MKKITTKQFIEKAIAVNGDKYDYSTVVYNGCAVKIAIICKKHGMFYQTPSSHLNGLQCKKCSIESAKLTNLERYGVENPAQNKEIQEKTKKTNIERYGYTVASKNKTVGIKISKTRNDNCDEANIAVKRKNTNIEKYGVENPFSNNEIKDKIKKTNVERYGVENPQQNKEIQEKTKKTNIERYGAKHHLQTHMINILHLIEDKEWLFQQYIVENKTSKQIAQELGVDGATICNYLNKHEIEIKYATWYSIKCIQWLELIMEKEGIFIQHAGNIGEYLIPGTRYRADGYCEENNTVYEFHGDCFHGNPDLFNDDKPHFYKNHLTAKELYNKTIKRENKIKNLGYNLVVMWENDFNKIIEHQLIKQLTL